LTALTNPVIQSARWSWPKKSASWWKRRGLRLGIKQGRFRDELDIPRVAQTLQDLQIAGYLFHGGRGVGEELMAQFAAGFDLVLIGLRVRPG
jgi:hypothetical protein